MHYVNSQMLLLSKTYNDQRVEIYVYRDSNRAYHYSIKIGFHFYYCRTIKDVKLTIVEYLLGYDPLS